jgi:iron(III) transport system substrate-binding protein
MLLSLLFLAACRIEVGPTATPTASETAEVWIYTSMYQEVIDSLTPLLQAKFPTITLQMRH